MKALKLVLFGTAVVAGIVAFARFIKNKKDADSEWEY